MVSSDDTLERLRSLNTKQFEDLIAIYQAIDEWGKKNFPEVDFRFEFNSDNINRAVKVKTTFLTAEEMNPDDRLFKTSELNLPELVWNEPNTMSKILSSLFKSQTQMIAKEINNFYNKSKIIANIE